MVSTPTSSSTESPIIKKETPQVTPKPAQQPLTGRQLLIKYLSFHPDAGVSYRKVCNALEILDRMEPQGRIQFIEQLVDTSDLLDSRCTALVGNLCAIQWQNVPEEVLGKFNTLLGEIAIRHVCHTETVYQAAVSTLLPKLTDDEQLLLSNDVQKKLYIAAHRMISHIVRCFPMSTKTLMSILRRQFPHYTHGHSVFNDYVRNLMQIAEYTPQLYTEIWSLIFDNATLTDAHLTFISGDADGSLIFKLDEEKYEEQLTECDAYKKCDTFNSDVFSYLARKHNFPSTKEFTLFYIDDSIQGEDIFQCMLSILENHVIMTSNVRYTSFIWLYICSLDKGYQNRLLDCLWNIIARPQRTQTDTKKAHGAASYIAAFIARAKSIKTKDAIEWLKRIFDWCVQYVDNISNIQTYAGAPRHGLFYALCQAFFIIFSFRYKEFVKSGDIEEIRRYGVGRIVHCSLEPLKYVSRPVGLCFGAISRSLQLVYVNHVLRDTLSDIERPFEAMFPLDSYNLHSTEKLISPLMRKFSPLAEDIHNLSSILQSDSHVKKEEEDSGMDFLDDDDLLEEATSARPINNQQSNHFTVYSTSPGLRQFDSH